MLYLVHQRKISPSENRHSFGTFFPNYNTGTWENVSIQLFKHDGPLLRAKYYLPSHQTYHLFVTFTYPDEVKHKLAWEHYQKLLHRLQKVKPCHAFTVAELQKRGVVHLHSIFQFDEIIQGISHFAKLGHKRKYRVTSPIHNYIKSLWTHGFVDIQAIKGAGTTHYTLKYLTKSALNNIRTQEPNYGRKDEYIRIAQKEEADYFSKQFYGTENKRTIKLGPELNTILAETHLNALHDLKLKAFDLTPDFNFEKLYYSE